MTADFYPSLATTGAVVNLSSRAKWRLSGADRVRYLNGQVTNDVRTARSTDALYACVTNVKGKIEGDICIHASPDGQSLLIDAPADLRDHLGMRLERYIIADDAVLEDITEEWQLWHFLAPAKPASEEGHSLSNSTRFHLPGFDLWLPAPSAAPAAETLDAEAAETLRILQKVPAYPNELNNDTFPQEAGLETQAMSFTKGCYIGQEILSRIKTTGKMPRQLIAWTAAEGAHLQTTEALLDDSGKEIGTLTSLTQHPVTRQPTGLAFIRQSAAEATRFKTASGVEVTVL